MIAVTFALPQESQDLVRRLKQKVVSQESHLPVIRGWLGEREVVICHTGIGEDSARQKICGLFARHRPRLLISAGFGGGLDAQVQLADLVVAENFSDPNLLAAVRRFSKARRCFFGRLTTQSEVAATAESKRQLGQKSGALAVDMETAAIAEFAGREQVPMLAVRSISDVVGESLPVPFSVWFEPRKQKPRVVALLAFLARHPGRIGPFARFVRGIDEARARLTDYLLELISTL